MASIDTELQTIEEAVYGSDMRQAIHDAIYKVNNESGDNNNAITSLSNDVDAVEASVGDVETAITALTNNIDITKTYTDENDNTIIVHLEKLGGIGIVTATLWLKHPELLMGSSSGTITIINDFSGSYRPQETLYLPLMLDSDGEALAASKNKMPSLMLGFVSPNVTVALTEVKLVDPFQVMDYDFSNYLKKGKYTVQRTYRIYEEE